MYVHSLWLYTVNVIYTVTVIAGYREGPIGTVSKQMFHHWTAMKSLTLKYSS